MSVPPPPLRSVAAEYATAALLVALVTAGSFSLSPFAGHAGVALLYLLLVVFSGLKFRRGPVLFVATSSALLWNFFFIPPFLSVVPDDVQDMMLFSLFFAVALAMGRLTTQLHESEMEERRREHRTAALYELVRQAGLAPDLSAGLNAAIDLTERIFPVRAHLLLAPSDSLPLTAHPSSSFALDADERRGADLAFAERRSVGGRGEDALSSSTLHLPLQTRAGILGVLSIRPLPGTRLASAELDLLEAFAALIAAILERDALLEGLKHAELLRASERLQRALLQSVSHELKTPLSAVQAGIQALANEAGGERSVTTRNEIEQALRRLRRVIDNLLDMTRIESNVIHPKLDWCDATEIVDAALDLAADAIGDRSVTVDAASDMPLVRVDQALLEQCVSNLLLNAATHGGSGTPITVRVTVDGGDLAIAVEDQGPGIAAADLPHVFEVFHRGSHAPPGGAGLGLAIVEGFVRAHGGTVAARNRDPRGAVLSFSVPAETLRPGGLEALR